MATATAKRKPAYELGQAHRVERFMGRHLRHTKGRWAGQPLMLEPWQRDEIIVPIFDVVDPRTGLRVVREALLGIPRKNSKSTIASGVGLYCTYVDGYRNPKTGEWIPEFGAEVYAVAGSKPQARIVFGAARDMVLQSPYLRAASKVYKDAIEVIETGGVFRVLSADARLAHGYNPSAFVIDEFHVHRNWDLYEAMVTGTGARQQPLGITITTAGYNRESPCFELYERGRKTRAKSFYFKWWEAPKNAKVNDRKGWQIANPASWVTNKFLAAQLQSPAMHPAMFRRLHLNQWTGTLEQWIDQRVWDACGGKPLIPNGAEVYIGVDAAPKRDSTAAVIVHRDAAGVHHVICAVWTADATMGYTDFIVLEDFLREMCKVYAVQRILVDPYAMQRTMMVLRGEGLPVDEFPQTDAYMVPASQNLYDLALEGRLRHGNDKTLRAHSDHARAIETARGWRLHKLRSVGHIDALVALASASRIAEQEHSKPVPGVRILGD